MIDSCGLSTIRVGSRPIYVPMYMSCVYNVRCTRTYIKLPYIFPLVYVFKYYYRKSNPKYVYEMSVVISVI